MRNLAAFLAGDELHYAGRVAFGRYAWVVFLTLGGAALVLATLSRSGNRIWHLNHRIARRVLAASRIRVEATWQRMPDLQAPHVIAELQSRS